MKKNHIKSKTNKKKKQEKILDIFRILKEIFLGSKSYDETGDKTGDETVDDTHDETDDETDEKQPDTTDLPDLESEGSAEQRN